MEFLSILLTLVSIQNVDTEYFAMAYDCNSAAIIHNLTMGSFQMEPEEILQQKEGRIQLIQKKMFQYNCNLLSNRRSLSSV